MPALYQVLAINHSQSSENRIHSDDVAKQYGFRGALVGGVQVSGYLSYPMVKTFGAEWLSRGTADVRFLKPAYHGDWLSIESAADPAADRSFTVGASNEAGELLAILDTSAKERSIDARADILPADANPPRVEVSWDALEVDVPWAAIHWQPDWEENLGYCERANDDLPIYSEGEAPPVHPYYFLQQCNRAFSTRFVLPAWIHASSEIRFRRVLRVGNEIEIRTIPIEKWERRGHQFARLYVAMWCENEVAMEVLHTAIFKIAERQVA
jgi:acyl dehydratase